VLALETTGRRSGRRRRTAVAYLAEDKSFVVGGGAAGQTRLPDWVANLRSNPTAVIWVRRKRIEVLAEELRGEARAHAYEQNLARYPRIEKYERLSGRPIPYFRLIPTQRL
jgi:deazaflavin-dependent oxidoreductase (nitroreductase family)